MPLINLNKITRQVWRRSAKVLAGDQDHVFELFLAAAIAASVSFALVSPSPIEARINYATMVSLVLVLLLQLGRRLHRNTLTMTAFFVIVVDMVGGIYFHGGLWSLNAAWLLALPLPILIIVGIRMAIVALVIIMAVVLGMYFVELQGHLPVAPVVTDHMDWWWMCVTLLSINIWVLPMIAHVTQIRTLATLRKRNAELEKTQRVLLDETVRQDLFVASVSHELRTPMNAIMGLMQSLQQRPITNGSNAKMFSAMSHSARHLLTVINDLLDFSQIQSDSLRVASRPMPLRQLFEYFEAIFSSQLSERGIDFIVSIEASVPRWALGDPDRLSQIVINLLGNATKFTRKGHVSLKTQVTKLGMLRVEVADTGRGIAADQLDQVFERFSSLTTQTQKAYGGTGLGLSISRSLIERMGGTIGVSSELGHGTCFWFEVPITECLGPKATSTLDQADPLALAATQEVAVPSLKSALIVDDSPVNRLVAKRMLLHAFPDAVITEAENGLKALASLHAQPVDLVLMDVIMPEMDGIEATQRIRETFDPAPPIIGLTADITEGVEIRCRQSGMAAVLTKPYDRQVLIQRVQTVLQALERAA